MSENSPPPSRRSGPGRPRGEDTGPVREALLAAAARRFATHGYAGTTVRQLAEEADVTPAMVHYYFGSKEGLYAALLESAFADLLPRLEEIAAHGSLEERLDRLFATAMERMTEEPWIPRLIVREVLSDEASFRDRFVRLFASRIARRMIGLFETAAEQGELRPDLDPRLAYVSLVGLAVFPLLARPVLEPVLGLDFGDPDLRRRLEEHGRRLFLDGARPRSAAPGASDRSSPS